MTDDLFQIRQTANRLILPLLWVQVPVIGLIAGLLGNAWLETSGLAILINTMLTAAYYLHPNAKSTRLAIAVAYITMVSLIVAVSKGSYLQIDTHMYFFAALAILTIYCDRDVILAAAGTIMVQHLAMNFVAAALVFPGGADLTRVLLHAAVVVMETIVLVWMIQQINTALTQSAIRLTESFAASKAASSAEAEAALQRSQAETDRLAAEIVRTAAIKEQSVVVTKIASGLSRLAVGDLEQIIMEPFASDYEALRNDFNQALAQLRVAMMQISVSSGAIRTGNSEITGASDDLARRTEQQAATLEETAAALDEVVSTVRRSAEGAKNARLLVSGTRTDAEQSAIVVSNAVTAMSGIAKSSHQISQIISVIDEIAFQTNLLALNAGIEAARAGDAGRGFAVVASEVRTLALRSTQAAKEVETLIRNAEAQVKTGVSLVNDAGDSLRRIFDQVSQIDQVVITIATAAQDQANRLAEINIAINQMDKVTQQNAAMVEETTAAAHALSDETENLAKLISRFKVGISTSPGSNTPQVRAPMHPSVRSLGRITARAPAGAPAGSGLSAAVVPLRLAKAQIQGGTNHLVSHDDFEEF